MGVLNMLVGLAVRKDALGGSPWGGNGALTLYRKDWQNSLLSYLDVGIVLFVLGYCLTKYPFDWLEWFYTLKTA